MVTKFMIISKQMVDNAALENVIKIKYLGSIKNGK